MILLACGGRTFSDRAFVFQTLDAIHAETPVSRLIHGGALGADDLAAEWAFQTGVPVSAFHADWQTHGKAAGPLRNQRMLDEGRPDLVVAFPGGAGTADMVCRAGVAGVRVMLAVPPASTKN